ncbi:MAG: hypothetical protein ACJAU6_003009 [Alphaproteobacteria bacterium]|jgi:hypothetical protein
MRWIGDIGVMKLRLAVKTLDFCSTVGVQTNRMNSPVRRRVLARKFKADAVIASGY